jgi:hypothetical protein
MGGSVLISVFEKEGSAFLSEVGGIVVIKLPFLKKSPAL